jgi:hypothetical protein
MRESCVRVGRRCKKTFISPSRGKNVGKNDGKKFDQILRSNLSI